MLVGSSKTVGGRSRARFATALVAQAHGDGTTRGLAVSGALTNSLLRYHERAVYADNDPCAWQEALKYFKEASQMLFVAMSVANWND